MVGIYVAAVSRSSISPCVFAVIISSIVGAVICSPTSLVSLARPPPLPISSQSAAHPSQHSHDRRLIICRRRLLLRLYLQSMTQTRAALPGRSVPNDSHLHLRGRIRSKDILADSLPPGPTALLFTTINIADVPLDCKVKQKMISEAAPEGE